MGRRRYSLRELMADPAPLPAGSSEYVDAYSVQGYTMAQRSARSRMAQFDAMPPMRRAIEAVVGMPDFAAMLIRDGVRTAEDADQAYRDYFARNRPPLSPPRQRTQAENDAEYDAWVTAAGAPRKSRHGR